MKKQFWELKKFARKNANLIQQRELVTFLSQKIKLIKI